MPMYILASGEPIDGHRQYLAGYPDGGRTARRSDAWPFHTRADAAAAGRHLGLVGWVVEAKEPATFADTLSDEAAVRDAT